MKATIDNCRTGTLGNKERLHMMTVVPHTTCPICPLEDLIGYIMGGCSHADMKTQYIARHGTAVRLMVKGLRKGKRGGNYIVADVGQVEQLKELESIARESRPLYYQTPMCKQTKEVKTIKPP